MFRPDMPPEIVSPWETPTAAHGAFASINRTVKYFGLFSMYRIEVAIKVFVIPEFLVTVRELAYKWRIVR